ncbi:MAG: hypothetical protein FJZ87_01695 [Chloroflexi bacterium]|nr:hypothetical protein [Chloroflexota bacterium]
MDDKFLARRGIAPHPRREVSVGLRPSVILGAGQPLTGCCAKTMRQQGGSTAFAYTGGQQAYFPGRGISTSGL